MQHDSIIGKFNYNLLAKTRQIVVFSDLMTMNNFKQVPKKQA